MKKYTLTSLMLFFLFGCATTVSITVDTKQSVSPIELSQRLSGRYSEIDVLPQKKYEWSNGFELGEWYWWEKQCGGFIGHDVKNGKLWIWIAPSKGCDGATEIKVKILKLLSDIDPSAVVNVQEARSPDIR